MSEREAFLKNIIANPDDDAVRLVFADWLDDNGEPERAQCIRVQIEWAKIGNRGQRSLEHAVQHAALAVAHLDFGEDAIFQQLAERCAWHIHVPCQDRKVRVFYRRGFVDEVRANVFRSWAGIAPFVCGRNPIRTVVLGAIPEVTLRANADRELVDAFIEGSGCICTYPRSEVAGEFNDALAPKLLAAEFPGIKFVLPEV